MAPTNTTQEPTKITRRLKSIAINVAVLAVSSVVSIVMVELGLRLYLYRSLAAPQFMDHADVLIPHPTLGWALNPDSFGYATKRDYKTGVRVNAHGLRDDDHPYEKPSDVFRILILGDSFMEAQQVPMTNALPYLLEQQLTGMNVEVINSGVNGYSSTQQLIYLREEGLKYEPDVVLQEFFVMNDVVENYRPLTEIATGPDHPLFYSRPFARTEDGETALSFLPPDYERAMKTYEEGVAARAEAAAGRGMIERTALHRYYTDWKHKREYESGMARFFSYIWYGICLTEFDLSCESEIAFTSEELMNHYDRAWAVTERILAETQRTAEEAGAGYAVFLVPGKFQIESDFRKELEGYACGPFAVDVWKPNRKFAEIADRQQFNVCPLADVFVEAQQANPGSLYFGWDDSHWTARGHQLATNELARWLEASGLLPPHGN